MINTLKILASKITPVCSLIVPKKKRLWVFGCWTGKLYADNSKYLFEYICSNHPEIEAVWITRSNQVKEQISTLGYKCYTRFSCKGIVAALRAEAAFITSDESTDISHFINNKKTKVIQLYHGISGKGANICSSENERKATQKRFNRYYWISTSTKYKEVFSNCYSINADRFYITGYPRNDTFVTKPYNEYVERLRNKYSNCRFIIYMPTHRDYGKRPIDISEFENINIKLEDNNIMMVYKPHFNEIKNLQNYNASYSNIIIANDQEVWGDVYAYVHYFDLLISDYSSIVYDFLCANKPIVLYTYDIEYMRNEDFGIFDFFEETPPGPFCYNWNTVLDQVSRLLMKDDWKDRREECRKMFHPFNDGKNSLRVYEAALDILKQKTDICI